MKRYLLAIISLAPVLLAIGTACSVTNHRYYTNCDDGKMTGLSKRIPLNGYYSYQTTYHRRKPEPREGSLAMQEYLLNQDKDIFHAVVFYEDGTECAASSYFNSDKPAQRINNAGGENIGPMSWGRYRITGDTIKVQFLMNKEYANTVIAEDWYRINKDATISYIAEVFHQHPRSREFYDENGFSKYIPQKEPCTFTPTAVKPDSMLSTLRGKKWYKCR